VARTSGRDSRVAAMGWHMIGMISSGCRSWARLGRSPREAEIAEFELRLQVENVRSGEFAVKASSEVVRVASAALDQGDGNQERNHIDVLQVPALAMFRQGGR
jgi:hypothetical protein